MQFTYLQFLFTHLHGEITCNWWEFAFLLMRMYVSTETLRDLCFRINSETYEETTLLVDILLS